MPLKFRSGYAIASEDIIEIIIIVIIITIIVTTNNIQNQITSCHTGKHYSNRIQRTRNDINVTMLLTGIKPLNTRLTTMLEINTNRNNRLRLSGSSTKTNYQSAV